MEVSSQSIQGKVKQRLSLLIAMAALLTTVAQAQESSSSLDATPTARIVGGVPTNIDLVPATVALLRSVRVNLDGNLFQAQYCGGTAITDQWILTAAHCVVDLFGNQISTGDVLVLAGSDDLDNPVNQPVGVRRIVVHPAYRSVEFGNDIALLQLRTTINATPAALDTAPVGVNDRAFIAGWGAVNPVGDGRSQSFPKLLRGTFVDMTSGEQCATLFPEYRDYANETQICAGVSEGGRDSCQGDSGGPLYRVNNEGTAITAVSGITSWGISCGVAETPGIYTNVSTFIGWIQTNMRSTEVQTNETTTQPQNDDSGNVASLPLDSSISSTAVSNNDSNDNVLAAASTSLAGLLVMVVVVLRRRCTLLALQRRT